MPQLPKVFAADVMSALIPVTPKASVAFITGSHMYLARLILTGSVTMMQWR